MKLLIRQILPAPTSWMHRGFGGVGGSTKETVSGRSGCRKDYNINMGLYAIGWNGFEWSQLALYREKCGEFLE